MDGHGTVTSPTQHASRSNTGGPTASLTQAASPIEVAQFDMELRDRLKVKPGLTA